MGLRRHIRIHAKGNLGTLPQLTSAISQKLQFTLTLHIKEKNSRLQRQPEFVNGLTHTGKNYFFDSTLGGYSNPLQLTSRNNVETSPQFSQKTENCQIGICLYRIADGVWDRAEGPVKGPVALTDSAGRVDVQRCAVLLPNLAQRQVLAIEFPIFVFKCRRPIWHDW